MEAEKTDVEEEKDKTGEMKEMGETVEAEKTDVEEEKDKTGEMKGKGETVEADEEEEMEKSSKGKKNFHISHSMLDCKYRNLLASFPGSAQLSVACSTEKPWRAWYLFSREHDVIGKWRNFAELTGCVSRILNRLHAQRLVCKTVASR